MSSGNRTSWNATPRSPPGARATPRARGRRSAGGTSTGRSALRLHPASVTAGSSRRGPVEANLARPSLPSRRAWTHDQAQSVPALQDQPGDHPPGGDDVHPVPALAEWRGLCAAQGAASLSQWRPVRIRPTAPFAGLVLDHHSAAVPSRGPLSAVFRGSSATSTGAPLRPSTSRKRLTSSNVWGAISSIAPEM